MSKEEGWRRCEEGGRWVGVRGGDDMMWGYFYMLALCAAKKVVGQAALWGMFGRGTMRICLRCLLARPISRSASCTVKLQLLEESSKFEQGSRTVTKGCERGT